jgi:hypothetical protein
MTWTAWLVTAGGVLVFLVIALFVWSLCRIAAEADRESALQFAEEDLVRPAGIEPATPSLEGSCSVQLSYGRGASDSIARLPLRSKVCPQDKPTNETGITGGVVSPVESRNVNASSANVTSNSSGADGDRVGDIKPNCRTCVRPLVYSGDLDLFYCCTSDCPDYRHVQMKGVAWREMEASHAETA